MTSGLKWCEWCYASLNVNITECANCDSTSFTHQDPNKPKILREEAVKRREGRHYDLKPKAVTSQAWDTNSGSADSTTEESSVLTRRIAEAESARREPSLMSEEHALNAEIAEIVIQIEILDRRLQELLNRKSPQIRKLNEDRDRVISTKAAKTAVATSAAASGISEVLGEFFSS